MSTCNVLARTLGAAVLAAALSAPLLVAQDRDGDRGHDRDRDRVTRIEPGTHIDVRTTERINVERQDNRIYHGVVEHEITGENGRLAIPRGSMVDLRVRVEPDNDLILDLDSVWVNGQRYSIDSSAEHLESQKDFGVVGSIVNALGGEVRGRAVRVPRDTVLSFRTERPLVIRAEGDHREGDRDRDRDR